MLKSTSKSTALYFFAKAKVINTCKSLFFIVGDGERHQS
jgi:hypothetical protein